MQTIARWLFDNNNFKYIACYIFFMATLSSDVTKQMVRWIDSKVKKGLYKSRSEVIRELLREKMTGDDYPKASLSESVLRKIWDNEEDEVWESYL